MHKKTAKKSKLLRKQKENIENVPQNPGRIFATLLY